MKKSIPFDKTAKKKSQGNFVQYNYSIKVKKGYKEGYKQKTSLFDKERFLYFPFHYSELVEFGIQSWPRNICDARNLGDWCVLIV